MARRIEQSKGLARLVELVKKGPARFIAAYESLEAKSGQQSSYIRSDIAPSRA
jgi:hypothetical protein